MQRLCRLKAQRGPGPSLLLDVRRVFLWPPCAFTHMTRAIKDQRLSCFFCPSLKPLSQPFLKEKRSNCLLWEPKIIDPPLPLLFFSFRLFSLGSSFSPPISSFLKDVIFIPNVVKRKAKEECSCEAAFDNGNETQEAVQLKGNIDFH